MDEQILQNYINLYDIYYDDDEKICSQLHLGFKYFEKLTSFKLKLKT